MSTVTPGKDDNSSWISPKLCHAADDNEEVFDPNPEPGGIKRSRSLSTSKLGIKGGSSACRGETGTPNDWPGGQEMELRTTVNGRGLFLPHTVREQKQLEAALLELALDERRDVRNQIGTRQMADKLRSDPGFLKGLTFELHVAAERSDTEPMTRVRVPQLPRGLGRMVARRQRVERTPRPESSVQADATRSLSGTLDVRRMSTPSGGGFRGKTPIGPRRCSSAAVSSSSSRSSSETPEKRASLPLVKLDWQIKGMLGPNAELFPLCSFPVPISERSPEMTRRISTTTPSPALYQANQGKGKAVKVIYY